MKMKKAISILLLIACLLLSLTACGGDPTPSGNTPGTSDAPSASDAPSSEAPTEKVDPDAPITEEMLRNHPVAPAEDFSYDVEDTGVTIRGYEGEDTIVVIPAEIEGKTVTNFKDYVFGSYSTVRAVLVPDTVETIGEVFMNNSVLELVICEGVTKLAGLTFGNCPALREVVVGENLQEIVGLGAFADCPKLETVHFTNSLTKIDSEYTFAGCDSLTIYGPAGSYIETFAKENGVPFQVE